MSGSSSRRRSGRSRRGIGPANLHERLALPSVAAVGGSWMVPRATVRAGDFGEITRLTAAAVAILPPPTGPTT